MVPELYWNDLSNPNNEVNFTKPAAIPECWWICIKLKTTMGFNIGIGAIDKNNQIDISCDIFLDRSYYNLISEYLFETKIESCLYQISIDSKIDIQPLTNIVYLNDDEEWIPTNLQSTSKLISLITELESYIDKVSQNSKNLEKWKKYISEDLKKHLEIIISSLKCFEEKKYEKVFFWYG
ncbi:hypothetical protein [Flavobacterium chungangense]|nr:hypothetical protein [Flavobacterium chungangense]